MKLISRLRLRLWLPGAGAFIVVGLLWQLVAVRHPYILPRLGLVWSSMIDDPMGLLENCWRTLFVAMAGLVLAFITAAVVAVAMTESAILCRAIMPLVTLLNVTPVVAIAPGLVVAFGFGSLPQIIVTALITFFPILVNMVHGLRAVAVDSLNVFTTLHASRWEVLFRLRLPSSLPFVMAALKVVFPLSLVGAVVAEFVAAGSSSGLGTMIRNAAAYSQLGRVYAGVVALAVMGVAFLAFISIIERKILFWYAK